MRVLVLSNMYPPHHLGGYELSCRDVVQRWRRAGHEVLVLTTNFRIGPGVPDDAPHVHRVLEWYWRDHEFLKPPPLRRLALERRNQARLRAALRRLRPDVVSVWHMGGMSMALLATVAEARVASVYVVCDEWPLYGPQVDPWCAAWARRPRWSRVAAAVTRVPTRLPDLGQHADFCFVSDFVRQRVLAATGWQPAEHAIVPSGIDTDDFPIEHRSSASWHGRLLCVGRVEPRKGFRTAVEALALLPGAQLDVVGPAEPEHRGELEGLASRLGVGDRVRFTTVPRSQLAGVYRSADALLFTSAWQEPFGLVPVEAMACSLPVVACATGGASEFLEDGHNCLVVPPQDPNALTAAIQRLAADAKLRDYLMAGGRETAGSLTIDRYAAVLAARHARAAGFR